jgi:diacylglycerol kinase family enzyme
MVATTSHHTFHRLSRLLTTFLAQMRPVSADHVENPEAVTMKQPEPNDQGTSDTNSTLPQAAPESTIEQDALPEHNLEPALSSIAVEHDDGRSQKTFIGERQGKGQHSDKSAVKYSTGSPLRCKKAYLIINPRAGHNFTRISDVLAILSAAGWKTDIAVKHYAGHAIELATRAAEQDYDLVIAYGGDGTINHVVNGVMAAKGKGRRKVIGVIPGGTVNQWASETSVPIDPVKATLALIESKVHTVDLGRLQIQEIVFPDQTQENRQQQQNGHHVPKSKKKPRSSGENYFLLTAGLGIDASVIDHTSKAMKQRVGPLAFDLAVVESLPEQHAFPIKITIFDDGQDQPIVWSGEAFQVILGNTRRYANALELTPDVYLDDGKLELGIITTGSTIMTLQQITSLLFRHKTDSVTAKHFLATHFLITLPASIHIHLDGSAVQLEDYLNKPDREALRRELHREHVMVTYRFDAIPHALRIAIPRTYDNALFEHASRQEESYTDIQQRVDKGTVDQDDKLHGKLQSESTDLVTMLTEHGYKVKLSGVATMQDKKHTSIFAGSMVNQRTGETVPVAVRINEDTLVLSQTGERLPHAFIEKVRDGAVVIAHGKKGKRGVIKAKHVVLPD